MELVNYWNIWWINSVLMKNSLNSYPHPSLHVSSFCLIKYHKQFQFGIFSLWSSQFGIFMRFCQCGICKSFCHGKIIKEFHKFGIVRTFHDWVIIKWLWRLIIVNWFQRFCRVTNLWLWLGPLIQSFNWALLFFNCGFSKLISKFNLFWVF
jgi:hypothetical protein